MMELLSWTWFVISMVIAVGYVGFLVIVLLMDIRSGTWGFWGVAGCIYASDYIGDFYISRWLWGEDAITGVLAVVALVLGYGIWFCRR